MYIDTIFNPLTVDIEQLLNILTALNVASWQVFCHHVLHLINSFFFPNIKIFFLPKIVNGFTEMLKANEILAIFYFPKEKLDRTSYSEEEKKHREEKTTLNIWKPFDHVNLALISLLFILNFFILIPCHSIVFLFPHISFITICYANEVIHRR